MLRLLDMVPATSLAASMRRSSISPGPAVLVASEMSFAAVLSPSARMTEACVQGGRGGGGGGS